MVGREAAHPDAHETWVTVERLQRPLCGGSRPHFFRGVCTVVTKLFHVVEPDVAVFGRKDYQQWRVISRMVRDLDFAVEVVGMPICREEDGLAMSRWVWGSCRGAKQQEQGDGGGGCGVTRGRGRGRVALAGAGRGCRGSQAACRMCCLRCRFTRAIPRVAWASQYRWRHVCAATLHTRTRLLAPPDSRLCRCGLRLLRSRNARLSPEARQSALCISRGLRWAEQAVGSGEVTEAAAVAERLKADIAAAGGTVDYVEVGNRHQCVTVMHAVGHELVCIA